MITLVQDIAVVKWELRVCHQRLDGFLFGTDLDIFVFIFCFKIPQFGPIR